MAAANLPKETVNAVDALLSDIKDLKTADDVDQYITSVLTDNPEGGV